MARTSVDVGQAPRRHLIHRTEMLVAHDGLEGLARWAVLVSLFTRFGAAKHCAVRVKACFWIVPVLSCAFRRDQVAVSAEGDF